MNPVTTRLPLRVYVRNMIPEDFPQVLAIDKASSRHPECEESLIAVLCRINHFGYVAEYGDRILGFTICHVGKLQINVIALAVFPPSRRRGVGKQLVAMLVGKLSERCRSRLIFDVRESNLAAQIFLRSRGFRATQVIRDHFASDGEDAYRFVYAIRDEFRGR
jgi:[ribosomal protein S18]-alanine N-acetyltransferase